MAARESSAAAPPDAFPNRSALPGFPTAHDNGARFPRHWYDDSYGWRDGYANSAWGEVPRSALELQLVQVVSGIRDRVGWWTKVCIFLRLSPKPL
jgi:hypothetical protein